MPAHAQQHNDVSNDQVATTNDTVNRFLGGRQPSWMTGSGPGAHATIPSARTNPALKQRSKRPGTRENIPSITQPSVPTWNQPDSAQQPDDAPPKTGIQDLNTGGKSSTSTYASIQPSYNTLLSPAPTDEASPVTSNMQDSPNLNTAQFDSHPSPLVGSKRPPGSSLPCTSEEHATHASITHSRNHIDSPTLATQGPQSAFSAQSNSEPSAEQQQLPSDNAANYARGMQSGISSGGQRSAHPMAPSADIPSMPPNLPLPSNVHHQPSAYIDQEMGSKRRRLDPDMDNAPHPLDFRLLLEKTDNRFRDLNSPGAPYTHGDDVTSPRLNLLREACGKGDLFYIAMHQVLCLWSVDRELTYKALKLERHAVDDGFAILQAALRNNNDISQLHLLWFTNFPDMLTVLTSHSAEYNAVLSKVAMFLKNLSERWGAILSSIRARQFPLLVAELRSQLRMESPTLQAIFFTVSRRQLHIRDGDIATQMMYVFMGDQVATRRPTTQQEVETHINTCVMKYRQLVAAYRGAFAAEQQFSLRPGQHPGPLFTSPVTPNLAETTALHSQQQMLAADQTRKPSDVLSSVHASHQTIAQSPSITGHQPPYSENSSSSKFSPQMSFPPASQNAPSFVPSNYILRGNSQQQSPATASNHMVPVSPDLPGAQDEMGEKSSTRSQHQGINRVPQDRYHSSSRPGIPGARPVNGFHGQTLSSNATAPQPLPPTTQTGHAFPTPAVGTPPGLSHAHDTGSHRTPQQPPPRQVGPSGQQQSRHSSINVTQGVGLGLHLEQPNGQILPSQVLRSQSSIINTAQPTTPLNRVNPRVTKFLPGRNYRIPLEQHAHDPYEKKAFMSALHQVNARSPRRVPQMSPSSSQGKYYQSIKRFAVKPVMTRPHAGLHELNFNVTDDDLAKLCIHRVPAGEVVPVSEYFNGSLRYRLRLCQFGNVPKDQQTVPESEWVIAPTHWPENIFITFNGNAVTIRRKQHNGQHQPAELTPELRQGKNRVIVGIPPSPSQLRSSLMFFMAVEVIETLDHQSLVDMVWERGIIPADVTKAAIRKRLTQTNLADDEVSIVENELSIDIADPFSSSMFEIPARGTLCTHVECFDLKNWLETRPTKPQCTLHGAGNNCHICRRLPKLGMEPSLVDKWKCPLCGGDARPYSLRIDQFLVGIRQELVISQKQGTKTVFVAADGTWTAKAEAEMGSDDENMEKKKPAGLSRPQSKPTVNMNCDVEVIELD